jgi:hypothetical protein
MGANAPLPSVPQQVVAARWITPRGCWLRFLLLLLIPCLQAVAQTDPRAPGDPEFAEKAAKAYDVAKARFMADTNNPEAVGRFAKACFDDADDATTSAKRAEIANEGIAASRHLLELASNSVPGHYYLAMNLGELARTKSLGALKIVTQMESEFNLLLKLDPGFDYAGPDRNLGLLYLDAPNWPLSLGSKSKARRHLESALKLCPDFPENHLNLIEAELTWGDKKDASAGLKALEDLWPHAREKLAGNEWEANWAGWEKRRDAARKLAGSSSKSSGQAEK